MKRKKFLQTLLLLCFLALLIGYANNNESQASINKISVQPEELNTKIILEATASIVVTETFYSQDHPATIVICIDQVLTEEQPQIDLGESLLVEDIKVEKTGTNTCRLLIGLKEKVPYRIYSNQSYSVVELNRIQRTFNGYVVSADTEEKLKQTPKVRRVFKEVGILDAADRLDVTAWLDGKAISQVFALESPLRLVVDFFDTLYPDPTFSYPVNKLGIDKVRTGQFQRENPYTISRLVFDLTEPRFYILDYMENKLVVSFSKTAVTRPVPVITPPTPEVKVPIKIEKPVEPVVVEEPPPQEIIRPRPRAVTAEGYKGELLSLRVKDADMRDVILYLGEFSGLNVVFDPDVRGTVSVDLKYVPWDQILDIVLKSNKMGKEIDGNVLRIATIGALTREAEEERRMIESRELAGALRTEIYELSYAKAADVETLLRPKISDRGEIIVDPRTNTLIITDVLDRFDLLERIISVVEIPTPQVSIEARIIEASSNFIRNFGIQWGFRGIVDPFYGNQTSLQFPNKIDVDGAMIPQGTSTRGIGGPLGGYAINLPAPAFSSVLGISTGNVLDTFRLDTAISALETSGEGKIISCPIITTQNNMKADIVQGRQIPVQTVANFTTSTRFQNAALELHATPQITAEGTIIMEIEIKNDAADFANLVNGIPPITTQYAKTTVRVPDGGTTVIGGIYRTEDSFTREKVPFLHKIPILGSLFKNFSRTKQNRELLIFITPRIIQ
ncbi:MAG: type IV pilus secretin PilQ [Candidatus Aminicenantes bacterium]|nr:type IV pilus secretin PilQ [Candidatus Aminicenantes bacterium]